MMKREVKTIWGSPIIGVKVLDSHAAWAKKNTNINIRTNSILIEMESNRYNELKQSLEMAGLSHRVRETDNFFALKDGEIALFQADSTTMAAKLIQYTQSGYKFSFFTIDPYGPTGIPLNFVQDIIRRPKHDVIIYMPYLDLHKKSGLVPRQNRSSTDEKLLQNYNEMFGNEEWQDIVRELDTSDMRRGQESLAVAPQNVDAIRDGKLELDLMNAYKRSLLSIDKTLTVKSIGLHFPDKNRTMYYLYLTTHDPTGALKMNNVLSEAGYQEHELRWKLMLAKRQPEGQLVLIDIPSPAPQLQTPPRATSQEIEKHMLALLGGKTLTRRDIYSAFADETYFATEIDKALRNLRKQKKASFEGDLRNNTLIKLEGN